MTSWFVRRTAGVAIVLTLAGCGSDDVHVSPIERTTTSAGSWARVPAVPLSPRTDPVVAWTGTAVLVIGGNAGQVCPPNADCAEPTNLAVDGAAFYPATQEWEAIAPAPVGLWDSWGGGFDSAVVGGLLVVRGTRDGTWLAYDQAEDEWQTLTPPAGFDGAFTVSSGRLLARVDRRIVSWEPALDKVAEVATYSPDQPLQDAQLIDTSVGPVLAGVRYDDAAPDEPTLTQVDVPDGNGGWRRIVTGQIGWLTHWDGSRLVGVEPGEVDGGEVNPWDHAYPYAGTLDPVSGDWQPLAVPQGDWQSDRWDVSAADDTRILTHGFYLDTTSGRWADLGRPMSRLDTNLSATWSDYRLFVLGGIDEKAGYEAPSAPQAWLWTPPIN